VEGNALERAKELQERTKKFALEVIRLFRSLPKTDEARIIGRQMLDSATSVAANYRAVCRARSRAEFAAKMGIVVEETDETLFWLEMLVASEIVQSDKVQDLINEGNQLLAIFVASQRTARRGSK